ncbi:type I secretion system permease/ATPase [uncultured Ferrimonas sp.]|uniref:type I secretion system permease/ATPase n=1 Tax=uncultured Ferrimonas sp. TaxID=432640 RepID=UPI002609BD31|nr:type I secretion system permease/ATPase [uncultured Ferrimonas sp.]
MIDPIMQCLVYLSRQHGLANSPDALRSGLPLQDGRLTEALLHKAAERAGLSCRQSQYELAQIPDQVLPAMMLLHDGSACIALSFDEQRQQLLIVEPETDLNQRWVSLDDWQQHYRGDLYLFKKLFQHDERSADIEDHSGHWFWSTLRRSHSIYRDVLIASILINLFALAVPMFTRLVYDKVVPNLAFESLWVLSSGVIVVLLFDLGIKMLRTHFVDLAGKKSDLLLSAKIFSKVMGMRMESKPPSVGAFARHMQEFESIRDFLTSATIVALIDVPFALLFLVVIWMMAGPLVLVPIVVVTALLLQSVLIQRKLRDSIEQGSKLSSQKHATLIESLTGLETLKRFSAQGQVQFKWEQAVAHMSHWSLKTKRLTDWVQNSASSGQQLASIAMIILGVYLIAQGDLTMGGLIAASMISGKAIGPLLQLSMLSMRYNQAKGAYAILQQLMAMPDEQPDKKRYLHRPVLQGNVDFDDVSMAYPGSDSLAVKQLSFSIKAGEKVAVIGRIGSGKTTIERLLLGLYQPSSGAIRLDGSDISQLHPDDLRRNVASVPQDPGLFYGSIRDNIILGRPHADDRSILRAAKRAGVTEFSNLDPAGLDRQVGEGGQQLSGGQRQAIAIARALLTDPPILLMDEPTSAMDNRSEAAIKQQLAQLDPEQTLVLITHKIGMLDVADRIVVMDRGRIVTDGPREQVLQQLKSGKVRAPLTKVAG